MAEVKRYYWLKLKRDFFKRHDIRIVESMPNGKDYILFYLKLLLESIDHDGELRFSDTIPYDDNMLSVVTNTNIDIVRAAKTLFVQLGMMEVFDDNTLYMNEVERLIGSETNYAEKMRESRKRKKQVEVGGGNNVTLALPERYPDIEKDIDKDIDKDKKKSSVFTPPTLEQVADYCKERKNTVNPQRFIDHYSSNGWMVGRTKMKDWKAAVRTWEQREFSPKKTQKFDERNYTREDLDAKIGDPLKELMEGM